MAVRMSFDEKCYELAEYFFPTADEAKLNEIAQSIQDAVEMYFTEGE